MIVIRFETRRALLAASAALLAAAPSLQAAPKGGSLYVSPEEVGNRGFFTRTAGTAPKAEVKWTKLYNGKDLSGWHAKDGKLEAWKANGELISCVAPGGGWLTSDKQYGDFEMKIEYRIHEGGNSGLGIRYPSVGDPAHVGMEIQILDDAAPQYKNLKAAQYNGGIYYQAPATAKASKKPGEWNQYLVRAEGPRIQVWLNGTQIQDVNVESYTKGEGGYKPLAQRPRVGHVGMQSHGDAVDFRNIYIRELK